MKINAGFVVGLLLMGIALLLQSPSVATKERSVWISLPACDRAGESYVSAAGYLNGLPTPVAHTRILLVASRNEIVVGTSLLEKYSFLIGSQPTYFSELIPVEVGEGEVYCSFYLL